MKVIKEGHSYELENFENKESKGQTINFIQKEQSPKDTNELVTVQDGTTNEEILEMMIDRLKYQHKVVPSKETACCLTHLEEGLMWLEKRTKDRIKRKVENTRQV